MMLTRHVVRRNDPCARLVSWRRTMLICRYNVIAS